MADANFPFPLTPGKTETQTLGGDWGGQYFGISLYDDFSQNGGHFSIFS